MLKIYGKGIEEMKLILILFTVLTALHTFAVEPTTPFSLVKRERLVHTPTEPNSIVLARANDQRALLMKVLSKEGGEKCAQIDVLFSNDSLDLLTHGIHKEIQTARIERSTQTNEEVVDLWFAVRRAREHREQVFHLTTTYADGRCSNLYARQVILESYPKAK
jgi:hypothetical protein